MQKENIDYMHFVSPYTTTNRIKRMLWEVCWTLLARPFPKSTLMPWCSFLLRMFGAENCKYGKCVCFCKNLYALEFGNERLCLYSIGGRLL